jgi:nucleoside-diphosphate-sugar epimerase
MTSGEQIWSYLHAHDLCRATHYILADYSVSGLINIGNDEVSTIGTYAKYIGDLLGSGKLIQIGNESFRPDQVMHLEPINQTLSALGWKPIVEVQVGLKDLVDWHRRGESRLDPFSLYSIPRLNF